MQHSNTNTGGPAFPTGTAFQGMTLRDYFAAKAMPWVAYDLPPGTDFFKKVAVKSYQLADAMLEARDAAQ